MKSKKTPNRDSTGARGGLDIRCCALVFGLLLVCGAVGVSESSAQDDPPNVFGTPDGMPPPMEDICDETSGAAYGLCTAYCAAMDCDSEAPNANTNACTKVYDKFMNITGEEPPCVRICPCWDPEDLNAVTAENEDINSCDNHGIYEALIQNFPGSTPAPGGFAADRFYFEEPSCLWREFPHVYRLNVTLEEAEICIDQVRARCEAIGSPIP